jgi:hypothetical protein
VTVRLVNVPAAAVEAPIVILSRLPVPVDVIVSVGVLLAVKVIRFL